MTGDLGEANSAGWKGAAFGAPIGGISGSVSAYRYDGSGFVVAGREYSVTFTNYSSSKSITIIWQETQDLNIIFRGKKNFGTTATELSEITKLKRITSLKTLAELVQSDYMYLINT
ncbi:MAG: hypothetical protein FWF53_11705 [Candidatus Azobacteroides sp.]|nr:hypothetical protein [Candidatus Azobacteroides sp.]